MDHTGGYYMAMAILLALIHRERTGEGQWVDLACTEAGLTLNGPALLDWSVNGRPTRRRPAAEQQPQPVAAHGAARHLPCAGDDEWIAIACRSDADWRALARVAGQDWAATRLWARWQTGWRIRTPRRGIAGWTRAHDKFDLARPLLEAGVPAAAVAKPGERVDHDPSTAGFGLWPTATHTQMGQVRVDGLPVHFSKTDWHIERGGPCLGEHTEEVLTRCSA
jgi:benzylsuccinate CoA-transferase BbsF subunit